jgi:multidrug efflux pump subunit AcrA (membrane-fusion protein)
MGTQALLQTATGGGSPRRTASLASVGWLLVLALGGCGGQPESGGGEHGHAHPDDAQEGWSVTAWGNHFEVFPECDPLIAGVTAKAHTHVTVLADFSPQREGAVSIVLRGEDGAEQTFRQTQPLRDGIYNVEITPAEAGTYDLRFVIEAGEQREEIPGGKVRVGDRQHPGGLIEGPVAPEPPPAEATAAFGDPVPFLKEQQWRTSFATDWVRTGTVRRTVHGQARVRPAAGGEVLLTAPLDGFVSPRTRLYRGMSLGAGTVAVRLAPRVGSGRSIAEIETELTLARARLERMEQLLALQAVSQAEVDAARARVTALEPLWVAARGGSSRGATAAASGPAEGEVEVSAPFAGLVAETHVIPGQAVQAGDPLLRIVRVEPVWIEVALRPAEAASLRGDPLGLHVRQPGAARPLSFAAGQLRWVAHAPEVDPQTGSVPVTLEVRGTAIGSGGPGGEDASGRPGGAGMSQLQLGTAVEAEILTDQARQGVVIPAEALVDDGGVAVVYVQTEGEAFVRVPVQPSMREGPSVLIEGLSPGLRLVTRGGVAIRRASLLSSGPIEGHVH